MPEPDVTQLVAGPGKLYVAPLGTATPIDVLPVAAIPLVWGIGWTPVGYTDDGIDSTYTPNMKELMVDEVAGAVGDILTTEKEVISAKLAEATLANMNRAIAASLLTTDALVAKATTLDIGSTVGPIQYHMVGIEGPAPGTGLTRVIIIFKAMAKSAVAMKMQRKDKVIIPVSFEARQIDAKPLVRIVDVTGHA